MTIKAKPSPVIDQILKTFSEGDHKIEVPQEILDADQHVRLYVISELIKS